MDGIEVFIIFAMAAFDLAVILGIETTVRVRNGGACLSVLSRQRNLNTGHSYSQPFSLSVTNHCRPYKSFSFFWKLPLAFSVRVCYNTFYRERTRGNIAG